ncbi:MAG TPA: hypothetical protein VFQ76_14980, partial [Longimicrobiaceae bacterium]|nr:hypothetical protein [Longimicrobiaceae bacterium]
MPKAHTLTDNFSDNARDTAKWYEYGPVQEVNQRLEIRPGSSLDDSYGGYSSVNRYDLTRSEVVVELVRVLRGADGAETYMALENTAGDAIVIKVQQGLFYGSHRASGASSSTHVRDLAYDPTAHRWLRIREQLGMLYYEYSADGCAWELMGSVPVPFDVTSVKVDLTAGTYLPVASPGTAVFDNFNAPERGTARRVDERRLSAREVREEAAGLAASRRHDEHANNNDEVAYPTRPLAGNYSKSLKHDSLGDPDPASYASLLRALESRDPADFEEIQLAPPPPSPLVGPIKLTTPQSGLAFDVEGPDAQELTMPPAPRFDSEVAAHEAGELYWMAVARDVYFGSYGSDPAVAAAITSLNNEFPRFGGTVPVTAQNVFRGIYPGEQVGPYVSQFLLKGNTDPRKPDGLGRDANEGFISYGARVIDQRLIPAAAGVDHLTSFSTWLNAQNGVDTRGQDQFDTVRRFIRNLRDGATFVHFDQVLDAFYNTAWILMSEPTGNQLAFVSNSTGRPQIDLES